MRTLSKSKILALWPSPRRLKLAMHRLDLREGSSATQTSFEREHQVRAIAQQLYDPNGKRVLIDPRTEAFNATFGRTQNLLRSAQPIFEAGYRTDAALHIADMMLRGKPCGKNAPSIFEVKTSASVTDYRGFDNERNRARHLILSAKIARLTFDRARSFDIERYDDDGRFGFSDAERVRLTLRKERDAVLHLMKSPLSSGRQVLERQDGTLEIPATVADRAMLKWWLRGFAEAGNGVRKTIPNSGRLAR